jgi:hypothetical protein
MFMSFSKGAAALAAVLSLAISATLFVMRDTGDSALMTDVYAIRKSVAPTAVINVTAALQKHVPLGTSKHDAVEYLKKRYFLITVPSDRQIMGEERQAGRRCVGGRRYRLTKWFLL